MEHTHGSHDMAMPAGSFQEPEDMRVECDGTVVSRSFGTWQGHVYPGIVLIIWGSWWAYNVVLRYLDSRHSMRSSSAAAAATPYRSAPWYPMSTRWLRYLEPALKIFLPLFAISVELYWDHPDGYRYLLCPPDTKLAGRFAVTHMNNWQHTSSYPAFVLAGLTDLLGRFIHLPAGLNQSFLALAFTADAFLMAMHKKHLPLDEMVHWLLYVTMLLCALLVLLEMRFPRNPLLGAGKAAALVFQGAWLVETAKIMMEDRPQWSMEYMGSTMMAPVVFTMIGVFICVCFLALYVLMYALKEKGLLWEPAFASGETQEQEPAACFDDDSAQHSEEGSPLVKQGGACMSPFHISHGDRRYAHQV